MRIIKIVISTILFTMLVSDVLAFSTLVGMNNVKMNVDYDRSQYVLPNGMQFQEVYNMQSEYASQPDLQFFQASTFGGSGTTQIGKMAIDADGNRYVTGGFTGTISYGGVTVESTGGYDFFIAKLDAYGDVLWYRVAHGSSDIDEAFSLDGGVALALDDQGNVYAGGSFVKELNFLGSDGDVVHTLTDGRDDMLINLEMFVVKYTQDGEISWALGGESGSPAAENSLHLGINSINSIAIDRNGYPYVAGGFAGTQLFGEEVTVTGESDFFITSLSKDGDYIYWQDVIGTPDWDYAKSISVDNLGYLNVLGVVGEGRMDLTDSELYWDNDTGSNDTFIISYDVDGDWYFASFLGAGDQIVGNSIASAMDGDIYVAGFFGGTATFEGSSETLEALGESDGYLVKYDLNGDMLWARQFGFETATADVVTLTENEDVLVLGRYWDSIIFEPHSDNPVILTTESESNIFMALYDEEGNFLWAKNIEGSGAESRDFVFDPETRPFGTNPLDIVTSTFNGGEITLTGDFNETLALDDITLSATGDRKVFFGVMQSNSGVSVVGSDRLIPHHIELMQNYPNPFNPSTSFSFSLPNASDVKIEVFTAIGQKIGTVTNQMFSAGVHSVSWDASALSSGTYVYRLTAGDFTETRKMTLLK
ncbi:MAG: T9SS type A sorting domain-containing protein [Balneolales bacterium]|nr:T9SS type A sorting domain-containing protein [Balneolales bacterium]